METRRGCSRTELMCNASLRHSIPVGNRAVESPSWRLPSGKALAEFALEAGLIAPLLPGYRTVFEAESPAGAGHIERRR